MQLLQHWSAGHRWHSFAVFPSPLGGWTISPALHLLLCGLGWHGDGDHHSSFGLFSWSSVAPYTTSLFPVLDEASCHGSLLMSVGLPPEMCLKVCVFLCMGQSVAIGQGQRRGHKEQCWSCSLRARSHVLFGTARTRLGLGQSSICLPWQADSWCCG